MLTLVPCPTFKKYLTNCVQNFNKNKKDVKFSAECDSVMKSTIN